MTLRQEVQTMRGVPFLAILGRFVFKDQITQLVEQAIPGYTIQWN